VTVADGKMIYSELPELAAPSHTALVIVDMQYDMVESNGALGRLGLDLSMYPAMRRSLRRLLDVARALLDATAKARRLTMANVVGGEFGTGAGLRIVPVLAQSGDNRYDGIDEVDTPPPVTASGLCQVQSSSFSVDALARATAGRPCAEDRPLCPRRSTSPSHTMAAISPVPCT
jgi:hypothetical protein